MAADVPLPLSLRSDGIPAKVGLRARDRWLRRDSHPWLRPTDIVTDRFHGFILKEADHFFKKVSLSISLAYAGSDEIRMGAGGRDGDPFLPSFPPFPPFIGIRSSDDQADGADGASE